MILPISLPIFSLQFEYVRNAVMNEYFMVFMLPSISIGAHVTSELTIKLGPLMRDTTKVLVSKIHYLALSN